MRPKLDSSKLDSSKSVAVGKSSSSSDKVTVFHQTAELGKHIALQQLLFYAGDECTSLALDKKKVVAKFLMGQCTEIELNIALIKGNTSQGVDIIKSIQSAAGKISQETMSWFSGTEKKIDPRVSKVIAKQVGGRFDHPDVPASLDKLREQLRLPAASGLGFNTIQADIKIGSDLDSNKLGLSTEKKKNTSESHRVGRINSIVSASELNIEEISEDEVRRMFANGRAINFSLGQKYSSGAGALVATEDYKKRQEQKELQAKHLATKIAKIISNNPTKESKIFQNKKFELYYQVDKGNSALSNIT